MRLLQIGCASLIALGFLVPVSLMLGQFAPLAWAFVVGVVWFSMKCNQEALAARKRAVKDARAFAPEPIHQSAHFATDAELDAAGCFKGGVTVGYSQESGRPISCPRPDVHQIVFGSTGSGKSTSKLMVILLTLGDEGTLDNYEK